MGSEFKKAISIGHYKALNRAEQKGHRRFLRQLARQGELRLLDPEGNALDIYAVTNGSSHYNNWYVDEQGAHVIEQQILAAAARIEEEQKRLGEEQEEQKQTAEKRHQEERKKKGEERKKRNADLKSAGLWPHPLYKTLKAARVDGWHRPKDDEYGGEQINLKGHALVRNPKVAQSKTWWEEAGYSVKPGEQPHAQRTGQYVVYDVYRDDQVEPSPPTAEGRLCLRCRNRLPCDRFLDNERICLTCWNEADEQRAREKADNQTRTQIKKDRKDYLKKTGFLPH